MFGIVKSLLSSGHEGGKASFFSTEICDLQLFNAWSSWELILGLWRYLCDNLTNWVFKLNKKMNLKVCCDLIYKVHRDETWHLQFVTCIYYCHKDKRPVLLHVLCWRKERNSKPISVDQNLLECERHGQYRHIIFPFTMLKYLSLNVWLQYSPLHIVFLSNHRKARFSYVVKSFWNSSANPNIPICFPNTKFESLT